MNTERKLAALAAHNQTMSGLKAEIEGSARPGTWQTITDDEKDGRSIWVRLSTQPDYGQHIMRWEKRQVRWQKMVYMPLCPSAVWWDKDLEQPDQWRPIL